MSFFKELKRRNVFRVGIAYAVASWVLLQVVDLVLDNIAAPEWVMHVFMLAVGVGFVAAMVVAWAYEMTPEGIKRESEVDRSQSIVGQTGRKLDRIIIGFLALAVVILLAERFIWPPAEKESAPISREVATQAPNQDAQEPAQTPQKSIAVLPFTNMSEDASNEYFADGISEEILNALAQVKELKVAGRTSAFAFKGRNEDLRQIGEALGVNHVLEGSVRKAGNTVRVTAQLIQVSDGFHLWSDTWDRELTDIFAIQDEIAAAILHELKAELVGDQSIASERVDPVIYEKYLLAKQRSYSRTTLDLQIAADLLREATEADPTFAAAWAQRGIVTLLLADNSYGTIPRGDAQRLARNYLDQALELDENQPEALAGMGLYFNNQPGGVSVWSQSIPYLERALELNPTLIDASNWLQSAYNNLGRSVDSLRILEAMFERDPLYKPGAGNLIFAYAAKGQVEAGFGVLERIRPFIRDEAFMARWEANLLATSGRHGEAYPKAVFGTEKDPDSANAQITIQVVMSGLGMDEELATMDSGPPFFRAWSLLRLDRREEALRLAQDWSDRLGTPFFVIQHFHATSQPKRLVEYVEARWPDLAQFAAEFPGDPAFGSFNLLQLAHAYRLSGQPEKFEQALLLARQDHDRVLADGFDSQFIHIAESSYWAIAGDAGKALDHLQMALDRGGSFPLSDLPLIPEWRELRDEPRFRELAERAHQRFNDQRVVAGLDPVEAEWPL